MKTADLIPFILLELNESDKYGFELIKAIETKSQGKIIIKQPTLYTLLKKLEKSKFIASYWEDSEIGGKRHYYKLTENGKLQVSTLPSYESMLKNVLGEEFSFTGEIQTAEVVRHEEPEKRISIMDELLPPSVTPSETILPSVDVFADNNVDSSTELEINTTNSEILKNSNDIIDEMFATNEDVSKFTEKVELTEKIYNEKPIESINLHNAIFDVEFSVPKNETEIKFVDYVDHKNSDSFKKAKSISIKMLLQSLSTSACLLLATLLSAFITSFTGRSALYYTFFIASILVIMFYPIVVASNIHKIRLKYQTVPFSTRIKQKIYIGICLFLLTLVVCIIINIKMKNNTMSLILGFKNFENIYAPLLMISMFFVDLLFKHMFMSKYNK